METAAPQTPQVVLEGQAGRGQEGWGRDHWREAFALWNPRSVSNSVPHSWKPYHYLALLVPQQAGVGVRVQGYIPPRKVSCHDHSPLPLVNMALSNEKPALCSLLPEEGRPS